jgi:1,4-dihydroxy-2-naphthoyl-CoA hydrolase
MSGKNTNNKMFNKNLGLDFLNNMSDANIVNYLGIEYVEKGDDYLIAKMPVDGRTKQPFGLLHGGASVVLAESLGSVASFLCLEDPQNQKAVGLEINANHIRSVSSGWVYGKVTNIHLGKKTHIWEIKISTEDQKLVCISRITVMIL